MAESNVTIRECVSIDDFKQCVEFERAIYNDQDVNIMPIRLYMLSKACKAPTIGAFDETGQMVGFVHTALALMHGRVIYHSHLAAVAEKLRHRDIGFRMKLAQRERALDAGISLIVWTFDPIHSRSAHFNINKLGAIMRRYEPNYYGEGLSTVFDPGVPSDRLYAHWWIKSPHVLSVLAGNRPHLDEVSVSVTIPEDVQAVRASSPEEHVKWRFRAREDLQRELSYDHIIRGFERDQEKGVGRYLFGPDEDQFHFSAYDGQS